MASASPPAIRLPNAPLVEAVFELRWALQKPQGAPGWYADPGFLPTLDLFTKEAARLGFAEVRDMAGPQDILTGHAIARRFYLGKDREFPLLQIGPGIFATNQSAEYDWPSFRKQVLDGIRAVLASYPKLPNFPLTPAHLELRYVDAFDGSLVDTTDFVRFADAATNLKISFPALLNGNGVFADEVMGRLVLQRKVKDSKATVFILDLSTGRRGEDESIIRSEMKVVTAGDGAPKLKNPQAFLSEMGKWLDRAHSITSPLFKDFVKAPIMQKFRKAK